MCRKAKPVRLSVRESENDSEFGAEQNLSQFAAAAVAVLRAARNRKAQSGHKKTARQIVDAKGAERKAIESPVASLSIASVGGSEAST